MRGSGANPIFANGRFCFIELPNKTALPCQKTPSGRSQPLAHNANHNRRQGRDQKAVETIHHAAMARNEPACVLRAKSPLNGGLEQVAALRNDGQD